MSQPELPKLDYNPHVFAAMNSVGAGSQVPRPLAKQETLTMKHTKKEKKDKRLP